MPITTFKRNEMKFLLSKPQFDSIIPKILEYMNPDKYCLDGKFYNVYNIYYDTADNYLIRTSLAKPYYKEKLRLRSYSDSISEEDKVFLELKKKIGGIVSKRRAILTLKEVNDFLQKGKRPVLSDYINEQVVNELEYFIAQHKVRPVVYISYRRMALFGKEDKNFRITFDNNIVSRRYDLNLEKGSYGEKLLKDNEYLMEIKIQDSVPLWLADILAEMKIYKASFSKYGTEYQNYSFVKSNDIYVGINPKIIQRKEPYNH